MLSDASTFRRRRLSMTPLVDIIFLLLLFFMLSSTFSREGEIELVPARAGASPGPEKPWFLQLGATRLDLNGQAADFETLADRIGAGQVLVSMDQDANAQRLVDLLAALRGSPGISVLVLE